MSPEDKQTLDEVVEINELLIRAARRCAYDLRHAANDVETYARLAKVEYDINYFDRADFWEKIFTSGTSVKEYRHNLHLELSKLQMTIDKLREVLKDNNIEDPTQLPFY